MTNKPKTVEGVRDEIICAIAEVRAVARSEHDEQRNRTADWLDGLFLGVTDARALRAAAADALSLYGGNGSFSDVGTAESHHAVTKLRAALRRGRSWFPRNDGSSAHIVGRFFVKHGRAGLVLPEGWYGRPFDSLFALTSAADLQNGLKIEIEGGRELICEGNLTIVETEFEKYPALKIEGFRSVSWNPQDGVVDKQTYDEPVSVVFVSYLEQSPSRSTSVPNYRSMPKTVDQPVAVRATAFIRPSRWLQRPVRLVRYDAYWADGRVDFGVDLRQMMYRVHTTDFAAIVENVHANCPETGAGQWVDESGSVVEGPAAIEVPSANSQGVRRKYGVSYEPNTKSNRMWRLGGGAAALGLGAFLTTGPISDGIAGFVGGLFCIFGLASLAGLIPRKHQ